MAKKKERVVIYEQMEIAPGIYDMWLKTDLAGQARAGQFISVYPNCREHLLPRPISICEAKPKENLLRIVYRVAGDGTKEFASYHSNDTLEILGTLGNGYDLAQAAGKDVFLMGGGIGIPPMLQLAKRLKEEGQAKSVTAILGYRDCNLFLKDEIEKYATVYVATEDGSVGTKGNVMNAIEEQGLSADVIYTCGPMPMLRAIKHYAADKQMKAYLSLEERMACGVGACLGCVCKTTHKDEHSHVNNARVCTDGPVFDAEEVDI